MLSLKQAAIAGLGVAALPRYVCRDDVKSSAPPRVLIDWIAGDSKLMALISVSARPVAVGPRLH
jgi:DNA-binding transcriptional LysR family regulator